MKKNKKILILLYILMLCACSEQETEETPPTPSPSANEQTQKSTPSPQMVQASASTQIYDRLPDRNVNLKLATQAVDGTVIKPGEEFSFNEIVGDRTEEKGYKKAIGYDENGEKEKVIGGGICQISSTLYMAALNGNYEITERHSHSHEVPYTDSDHDATVSYGGYDFKFRNNRDKPIEIAASIQETKVFVTLTELPEKN